MPDYITAALPELADPILDRNQSVALIDCLLKAAELGERTGNLDLAGTALYCADLIIDKWLPGGDSDV